jgi:hypothetical protein
MGIDVLSVPKSEVFICRKGNKKEQEQDQEKMINPQEKNYDTDED